MGLGCLHVFHFCHFLAQRFIIFFILFYFTDKSFYGDERQKTEFDSVYNSNIFIAYLMVIILLL